MQIGEDEFAKLSQEEQQRRIEDLRQKEKQLRKEGKLEEAAALIGKNQVLKHSNVCAFCHSFARFLNRSASV